MSRYQDTALLKGLCCLATAEQVHELITVVTREELAIGLPKIVHARAESEVCRLASEIPSFLETQIIPSVRVYKRCCFR